MTNRPRCPTHGWKQLKSMKLSDGVYTVCLVGSCGYTEKHNLNGTYAWSHK